MEKDGPKEEFLVMLRIRKGGCGSYVTGDAFW